MVNQDKVGVLIKSFEIQDYVNATIRLANNEVELKRLAKNAYKNAGRFSFDNIYSYWQKIFDFI